MALDTSAGKTTSATLVAEYVRMSTDKQDTSIVNQRAAIAAYAAAHDMVIARSYRDEGCSGLDLAGRPALRGLLDDVQSGALGCAAILVLDVSRWGRFQDIDESAFYEHLCTRHGVRVIYVAELFADENGPLGAVLKSLKRTMAAEYSRELSAKVFAGQARLVRAGFTMGGPAPYGLSRMLVDAQGHPRALLAPGDRKSIATDRVRLVPGPGAEVKTVRWLFRNAAAGCRLPEIVRRLNASGSRTRKGRPWTLSSVRDMINDERYIGTTVFGRDNSRRIRQAGDMPREAIRVEHAFPPVIQPELFHQAQVAQRKFSTRLTDDEILNAMRDLWRRKGRISSALLAADPDTPTAQVYLHRFGSLRAAYKKIGYVQERDLSFGDIRDRMRVWLPSVIGFVADMLEDQGSVVATSVRSITVDGTWTALFQLMQSSRNGRSIRWVVPRWRGDADLIVGIRMDVAGDFPLDYLILPGTGARTWPTVIGEHPDAGARFYLYPSLSVFRRLGGLSRCGERPCS
jgi:DNA invertase Pin-like site-specific DNA recombinase